MDWQRLLENFGIPIVALVVMCTALYYLAKFCAKELLLPFRDNWLRRATNFFDKLDKSLENMQRHNDEMRRHITITAPAFERIEGELFELSKDLEGVVASCDRMEAHVMGRTALNRQPRQRIVRPKPPRPHYPFSPPEEGEPPSTPA